MLIKTDKDYIILIPENDFDMFNLGRISLKIPNEHTLVKGTDEDSKIPELKIKKRYLIEGLLKN